jgi:hypothetical protein
MKRKLHLAFAAQICQSVCLTGLFILMGFASAQAQISVPNSAFIYSQDFSTLANTGTSSIVPAGWAFFETGANQNAIYTAGTGSGTAGDTYSFGTAASTERAFGGLQSGSLIPTVGVCFTNNTGGTITGFTVTYTGETWRVGAVSRTDGIQFQYNQSTTAISGAGTWTSFAALDYFNPGQAVANGTLQHSAIITSPISGLTIAPGATFCLRWNDFNAIGADDGIGVDDFFINNFIVSGGCPAIAATISGAGTFCNTSSASTSLSVAITGGTGPYNVVYTDGITNFPVTGYTSGAPIPLTLSANKTFTLVSVTDLNSCTAATLSGSAVFAVSSPISATLSGAGNFCLSGNTNSGLTPLKLTITGGTGPSYTIDHTDGLATDYPAITGYVSGTAISHVITFTTTYTPVSVTDANGCPAATLTGSATFFVSQSLPTAASSTQSDPTTCGGMNGSINITSTSGGMGPYMYTWSTMDGGGIVQGSANQTTLGPGTYTLVITDANGCQNAQPITFTLNNPQGCSIICPTFGGSSNPSFVCNGGNFTLSVTGLTNMSMASNGVSNFGINFVVFPAAVADPYTAPGGTLLGNVPFASLGGGGTSATLTVTNSTLPVGNYVAYAILTPTPVSTQCRPSVSYTFQVVPAVTVFNVTGGGSACENSGTSFPIGLSGSQNGYTYNLFLNATPPSVATLTGTGNALNFGNFNTAGTYTVVASDNTGASCTASMNGSATITTLPESPVPTVTTPVVYCQGDVAAPLTANGSNLLWYTSLADPTGDPVAPIPSTAVVGNTSYYVTQTTTNTSAVSTLAAGDMAIVAFDDGADVFGFIPFVDLAAGTTIYFTDNGWDQTLNAGAGGFRGATATNGEGSEDFMKYVAPAAISAGTIIYSNGPGFVTGAIPGATTGVFGTALAFAAAGDQVYAFQNSNASNPMFNVATITHLFVFDDTNGFEDATTAAQGNVPPGLTAGVTANTFPNSSAIAVINDNMPRTAAQWLTRLASIANYNTGSTAVTNLNVIQTGSTLCESDRVEIVVTINAPATATIPAVSPVCINTAINLSVTLGGSAQSGMGTWSANVAGGTFAPNNTANNVTYTPPTNFTGTITFTYTTNDPAGPCPAGTATQMVQVQTGGVNAGPDQTLCSGMPASISGTLSSGAAAPITWTASVAGGTFGNATSLSTTYTPPAGFSGNITLTLTATSTGPCANPQDQLVLTYNPLPVAPTVVTPVVYCQNAPAVPLTATGNDLLWYTSPADLTGDPVAPTPSTAVVGNTSYYVTQTVNTASPVSVLSPGDLAIIALKDGADNFAFVPFVNLAAGTVIYFTDNGWDGTQFRGTTATNAEGNEDIVRYTAPSTIQAGTVITMLDPANPTLLSPGFAPNATPIPGASSTGQQFHPLDFNAGTGDQIYAFQNSNPNNPLFNVATQTHLFVYDETNGFEPATSATTGDITPGLTLGTTANTFNFAANNTTQLINDGATRTPAQWLGYIANAANYAGVTGVVEISIADLNLPGGCESPRATIVVTVNPSPAIFNVTGGGEVCTTDNVGVAVGLSGSQLNVNYQLLLNNAPVGAPVAGTGNPISFGPQLAVGTYTVTATATPGNCTAPMNGSAVVSNFNCNIVISDPCVCLNNATTLTNGQFGEQIKVNAPGTQTWTVTAISGFYNPASPNPPSAPIPVGVGTVLVNIGGNMFTLDGRHVDAIGYTITVSNGMGTSLSIGNSCQYPNPAITSDLTGPFCLYSDIVTLTGTPGDANIVSQGFTVNGVPATQFDPGAGVGTYVITYTVNGGVPKAAGPDDPGCIQSVSQTVQVVTTPSNLACNDLVTVSLDADCTTELLPDMVLEGSYACYDDYFVEIDRTLPLGNGPWQPGVVNELDINHTYAVRVVHQVSGNTCWGLLKVEDKIPPVLTCTDFNLNCNVPSIDPDYLVSNNLVAPPAQVYPVVTDCQAFTLTYKDVVTEESCASGFTKTIVRTWTAVDASGNKASCSQTIHFLRPTLADVNLPDNYDGLQAPFFACGIPYPTPEFINGVGLEGTPTVFGQPDGCNIGWGYTDERIDICEGTYKVIRHWTIIDWCTNQHQLYTQLIKVVDNEGPVFDAVPNMVASTNPSQCCANVNLPDVIITDNCSRISSISAMVTVYDQYLPDQVIGTYTISGNTLTTFAGNNFWDRDTLGNFGTTPCLPIGVHQVMYRAEDACGNTTTATFRLTVRDETPPVATCTQFTTVAIDADDPTDCYEPNPGCEFAGVAWVPASAFNQGSHDNCNGMEFTIRRMSANGSYGDCIDGLSSLCDGNEYFTATAENDSIKFYCCEVGTTQTVIFRVYQLDINGERDYYRNPDGTPLILPGTGIQYIYNECMINVEVQDKIKPTCVPPANVTINCENFDPTLWAYGYPASVDNCCLDQTPPTSADPQGQVGIPAGTFAIPDVCGLTQKTYYNNFLNAQFDTTCNRGIIIRRFTAWDCAGFSSSCTQRIQVDYNQNYYLKLPDDKTVYACNGAPNSFGYPTFYGEDCELLGVSYNDVIFTVVPDACYKIERTWTIINWCTYNPDQPCIMVPNPNPSFITNDPANVRAPILSPPGTPAPWAPTIIKVYPTDAAPTNYGTIWQAGANCYKYKQIVKVLDAQDPVFEDCPDTLVTLCDFTTNDALLWNQDYWWDNTLQTHDLCEGPADLSVSALDSCSGTNLRFRFLLWLDLDNDGEVETVVSSANPPEPGTIHYNNINTPDYEGGEIRQFQPDLPVNQRSRFVILENYSPDATHLYGHLRFNTIQSPTVYTIPQLPHGHHRIEWIAEDLCGNETVCKYDFEIKDCKPPVVACANVNINLMVGGMATLWATDFFLYGEDNCTPTNILNQSLAIIRADENPGNTYPGGSPANQSVIVTCLDEGQDVPVQVWLQDAAGNYDYCTAYVNVQANVVGCENFSPSAAVAGKLAADGQGVEQANVQLTGTPNINAVQVTGDNGTYHFAAIPLASDLTITPTKDDNPLNGVSTYDLVLISKHILGLEPLTTPYKMIAADANRSGSITTFDIVEFRKLILGIYNELPNNTSWRFVEKAYTFPTPANPFQSVFPENISVNDLPGNMLANDFEAVKVGDVNGTAIANSLQSAEERTSATMLFDVDDRQVKAGEVFTVNFKGAERVQGYQFTMNLSGLEVMDIAGAGEIKAENFGVFEGALTTSVDGTDNEFAVTFRATKAGQLSSMLGVSSRITKAEGYSLSGNRLDVAFRFNNGNTSTISGVGFELYQNQPNPFVNKTFIGFHLPEATSATLRVFDETGRMVFSQSGAFAKGYNTISLDRALLNATGMLYYTLETATDKATKKMIQSK